MSPRSFLLLVPLCCCLHAQTSPAAPPAEPDVLIFTNGEKLLGHLVRAHGAVVTFKSDSVGEVNVDWKKIQELHSSQSFAVLDKGVKLGRHSDLTNIPQGRVSMADQKLTVVPASGQPKTIAVGDAAHLVDSPGFEKDVLHNPGFFEDWTGVLTAGASLVEATQESRTFTGAVHFVRALPTENWLEPRNRTLLDFTASDGVVSQPGTPNVKTNIIHAGVERDEYLAGTNDFVFGQALFDHNYSQGLDLQQTYAGGFGWTVIKHANTSLDFRASLSFTRQQFTVSSSNHNLFGSVFAQSYAHKFGKGIQFLEQISAIPAWNEVDAWAAAGSASLNVPVYKRLGFSVGVQDSFLNDPPPGFKKNSFQFTTSLSYALK